ncbi:MAG: acetyl-CoA carboxylase biotin carboxyl carrier protein [Spirochaetaceae bacterium]|jgi:acetyl-CoA carboxylase biotin carboxyl carrier protein|nr:acetyl-CoA carboxylase biotin carboxyl carrier protein [Spirochaetaceae bacterium]
MNEQFIYSIIERFDASSLTALTYSESGQSLILEKGGKGEAARTLPAAPAGPAGSPAPSQQTAPNTPAAPAGGDVITSPIVATFYASNMPDAPPFVKPGDKVKKGQTLCILEAMKMMNKLDAEADCEILAIKAKPGDLVEFGQVLFEIRKL